MKNRDDYADVSSAPAEADADESLSVPRSDELTEKQLAEFAQRYQVVCLIEGGKTARQALEHMMSLDPAFKPSLRWAQNIHARFKRQGVKGLLDGRTHNKNGKVVLTPEVKHRILA